MENKKSPLFLLSALVVSVFLAACVTPTLTALYTGNKSIHTLPEAILAFSPDILFISTLGAALFIFITKKHLRFEWQFFDTVISLYLLFNLIYGFILSNKDMCTLLSVRITYLPITFYYVARLFNSQEQSKKTIYSIFMVYVVLAIIGLLLYFVFPRVQDYLLTKAGYVAPQYFIIRMCSLYLTPVFFGTAMAFSITYYCQKYYANPSSLNLTFYLVLWTCLLLSISRGAIMSYGISFVVISLIYKRRYNSLMKMVIGMVIIVLGISYYATQGLDLLKWSIISSAKTVTMDNGSSAVKSEQEIEQEAQLEIEQESAQITENENNATARVNLWQTTINDFKQQPWGYGLGKAGHVAHRHLINTPNVKASLYSTDGWYLKMACENGVLGLLSYLTFAGILLYLLIKKIKIKKDEIPLLALGLFIIVNIQSVFSNTLDFHPLIGLYWFIIGLSMNTYAEKNEL